MVNKVNYDNKIKTFEGMLLNRVATAFKAMDIGSGELVDEIIEQIEMLFKLKKELNEEYQKIKLKHERLVNANMEKVNEKVKFVDDDLTKRFVIEKDNNAIAWAYRKDMLDAILNIMNDNEMIPFAEEESAKVGD